MKKRESYLTCSNLVFLKAGKYKVIIIYSTKGAERISSIFTNDYFNPILLCNFEIITLN